MNATNGHGNTPLFTAVFNSRGRGDMIRLLRDHGADPFVASASGQTPVGLARLIGNYLIGNYPGLTIPYVHKGVTDSYAPDFMLRLRHREDDPAVTRTLIVEVSGGQKSPGPTKVKGSTARDRWCVAVNNQGGFGRWGYIEITDMPAVRTRLGEAIAIHLAQSRRSRRTERPGPWACGAFLNWFQGGGDGCFERPGTSPPPAL